MTTRLLIKPNSDIRILDTVFVDGKVGLLVDKLEKYDVEVGDVLILRFENTELNPQYSGYHFVRSVTDYPDVITIEINWGNSGPRNPGFARNWLRIVEADGDPDLAFHLDRPYIFDVNKLAVDGLNRYVHGGLYNHGTYSNVIGGRVLENGNIDETFLVEQGFNEFPRAIIINEDNSMYIGGRFTSYNGVTCNRLVKLHENGTIDTSFNIGTGFDSFVYDIAKVSDGLIVTGAFTNFNGNARSGIVKLRFNGSIDPTFNVGTGLTGVDRGYSVCVLEDGRIMIGGSFSGYNGNPSQGVVLIQSDGTYDPSFNPGFGPAGNTIAIKQDFDGKIFLMGDFSQYNLVNRQGVCKIDTTGALDSTWNLPFNSPSGVTSVSQQSNGKWIVSGSFTSWSGSSQNRIVRLNEDLTRDTTFNIGTGFQNAATCFILNNGSIICHGLFDNYNGGSQGRMVRLLAKSKSIRYELKELDLKEDIQYPLTYTISDIKDFSKRRGDFSKTITLPGTKNNNKVLAQLFDIGADSVFNVNEKKDIICLQNGLEIFSGYLKIDSINREKLNDISYDVKIFGSLPSIYSKLYNPDGSDLLISDLDYSEYNHNLSRDLILDSWDGNIVKNGATISNVVKGPSYSVVDTYFWDGNLTYMQLTSTHSLVQGDIIRFYPDQPNIGFNESWGHHTVVNSFSQSVVINLQFNSSAINSGIIEKWTSTGEGYVYPTIGIRPETTIDYALYDSFSTDIDYKPAIFYRTVWDKIFDYIGARYISNFIESDYFNRMLMVPILGTSSRYLKISGNMDTGSSGGGLLWSDTATSSALVYPKFDIESSTSGFYDTFNTYEYNPGMGINQFTADRTDTFVFKWSMVPTLFFTGIVGQTPGQTIAFKEVRVAIDTFYTINGGSQIPLSTTFINLYNVAVPNGVTPYTWALPGPLRPTISDTDTMNLNQGDVVKFGIIWSFQEFTGGSWSNLNPSSTPLYAVTGPSYPFTMAGNMQLRISGPVWTNKGMEVIPSSTAIRLNDFIHKIKAKDFLNGVIRSFNLYLENTRVDSIDLNIEPINDYYAYNGAVDWTDKVDLSKNIKILPDSTNFPKFNKFTHKLGSDYYSKLYNDTNSEIYGQWDVVNTTQFNGDISTIDTGFVSYPLYSNGIGPTIPTIMKGLTAGGATTNMNIMYWVGLRYHPEFEVDDIRTNGDGQPPPTGTDTHGFRVPLFGYAGHFDNPDSPFIDINFGPCLEYYYPNPTTTTNTLFKFYDTFISNRVDQTFRIVEFYVKLNSYDINSLRFNRRVYINNQLYILESINDYDPLLKDSVKCIMSTSFDNPI